MLGVYGSITWFIDDIDLCSNEHDLEYILDDFWMSLWIRSRQFVDTLEMI
jgi:hypothetical protein